jgi:hypothetical protein
VGREACRFGCCLTLALVALLLGVSRSPAATRVPLVVCPTSFASSPPARRAMPGSAALSETAALADGLAVYTDTRGYLRLLAPRGWACSGRYGADGSGRLEAAPQNSRPAVRGEAVVASETSACYGCTTGQACVFFPAAARAYRSAYELPCPARRPARETVIPLSGTVVAFEDPPHVRGQGVPSGGLLPANGVMTYVAGGADGSFLETCTLPEAVRDTCTAILNDFVARYARR